jgi:ADP-heptose:LPS heptosyltransferase
MSVLKSAMSVVSCAAWPAARAWARGGYFRPQDLATLQPQTVALVACHWIGDTFWATQVGPALAERFPAAAVHVVTKPLCADLWHGLIPPQRVLEAPEVVSDRRRESASWIAIARRARRLRPLGFDLVIDLTGNRYSAWLCFLLRPRWCLGFGGGELGWLYSHRVCVPPRRHLSEQPFRVIEPLLSGRQRPFAYSLPLRPPTPTCAPEAVRSPLGLMGRRYHVLVPGAGWPAKQWPAERFAEVGRILQDRGAAIVVTGSAGEKSLCESLAGRLPGAVTFVGRPIGQVVALLATAEGVLANDSGLAHLAAALHRRTATIFTGVTDPCVCRPLGQGELAADFDAGISPERVAAHLLG